MGICLLGFPVLNVSISVLWFAPQVKKYFLFVYLGNSHVDSVGRMRRILITSGYFQSCWGYACIRLLGFPLLSLSVKRGTLVLLLTSRMAVLEAAGNFRNFILELS